MGLQGIPITPPPCLLLHPRRPARPSSSTSVPTTRLMLPRLLSRSAWHSSVELPRELSRWPELLERELDPTRSSRWRSQRRSRRQRSQRPRSQRRARRLSRSQLPRRLRSQRRLPRSLLPRKLPRSLPRRPPRSQRPRRLHPRRSKLRKVFKTLYLTSSKSLPKIFSYKDPLLHTGGFFMSHNH